MPKESNMPKYYSTFIAQLGEIEQKDQQFRPDCIGEEISNLTMGLPQDLKNSIDVYLLGVSETYKKTGGNSGPNCTGIIYRIKKLCDSYVKKGN